MENQTGFHLFGRNREQTVQDFVQFRLKKALLLSFSKPSQPASERAQLHDHGAAVPPALHFSPCAWFHTPA